MYNQNSSNSEGNTIGRVAESSLAPNAPIVAANPPVTLQNPQETQATEQYGGLRSIENEQEVAAVYGYLPLQNVATPVPSGTNANQYVMPIEVSNSGAMLVAPSAPTIQQTIPQSGGSSSASLPSVSRTTPSTGVTTSGTHAVLVAHPTNSERLQSMSNPISLGAISQKEVPGQTALPEVLNATVHPIPQVAIGSTAQPASFASSPALYHRELSGHEAFLPSGGVRINSATLSATSTDFPVPLSNGPTPSIVYGPTLIDAELRSLAEMRLVSGASRTFLETHFSEALGPAWAAAERSAAEAVSQTASLAELHAAIVAEVEPHITDEAERSRVVQTVLARTLNREYVVAARYHRSEAVGGLFDNVPKASRPGSALTLADHTLITEEARMRLAHFHLRNSEGSPYLSVALEPQAMSKLTASNEVAALIVNGSDRLSYFLIPQSLLTHVHQLNQYILDRPALAKEIYMEELRRGIRPEPGTNGSLIKTRRRAQFGDSWRARALERPRFENYVYGENSSAVRVHEALFMPNGPTSPLERYLIRSEPNRFYSANSGNFIKL